MQITHIDILDEEGNHTSHVVPKGKQWEKNAFIRNIHMKHVTQVIEKAREANPDDNYCSFICYAYENEWDMGRRRWACSCGANGQWMETPTPEVFNNEPNTGWFQHLERKMRERTTKKS
jgi:hypothetical protein